jgi:hypothetical protein
MANKFYQGIFTPKNPHKYVGKKAPIFRSGWEKNVMDFFDQHPSVVQWASESIQIPYHDPLTGKHKMYIPDFFIIYLDSKGDKHAEIIEVKPSSQTGQKKTKSAINNCHIARNTAKFSAAMAYCEHNGISFRVLTELEIFGKR